MKTKQLITTLSIAALTLTGCGNNAEPQTSEDQQAQGIESTEGAGTMQAGEYEIHPELGGHATLQIPADTTSEEVAPFEEYRQENNLEPVTYLTVDADNRDGTEMLKFPEITVYDEQGNAYTFEHVEDATSQWEPERSWDMDDEQFWSPDGSTITLDEYLAFESQYKELTDDTTTIVNPAERATILLAYNGDDLPEEFTRVSAMTYGLGYEEDAHPTDD